MASNYNQRSGSSGSNSKPSSNGRSNNHLNRKQAGRYAGASNTSSSEFADRVAKSRSAGSQTPRQSTGNAQRSYSGAGSGGTSRSSSRGDSSRSAASGRARDNQRSRTVSGASAPRQTQQRSSQRGSSQNPLTRSYQSVSTVPGERFKQPPNNGGRRVSDSRARERDERMRVTYRKYLLKILVVFLVIAALLAGGIAIYNSNLFSITEVEVTGNSILSSEDIISMADIPEGETLLRLDRTGIKDSLLANPWVESVEVHWSLPHGVQIVVHEKSIAARVQIPLSARNDTITYWAISSDGLWLSQIQDDSSSAVDQRIVSAAASTPLIDDVTSTISPSEGTTCTDAGVVNTLEILSTISSDLLGQLSSISAPSVEQTELTLTNGVVVAFGSSSDAQSKERVVLQLLAEHENAISYINVRVVNRPAWRGITQDNATTEAATTTSTESDSTAATTTTDSTAATTTSDTEAAAT